MPQQVSQNMARQVAAPQHYAPPTARELRAQAVHRLQIGITGLAGMLLLVSLANIIMSRAQLGDAGTDGTAQAETAASDPLADIGVAPAASPDAKDSAAKKAP